MEIIILLVIGIACILIPIAVIGFFVIAVIPRSIKLLKIRFKKVDEKIKRFEEYEQQEKRNKTQNNTDEKIKRYATGWTFNEKTQLWEPPDYVKKESDAKHRKHHEDRPPTFEEWRAQKEQQEINSTPANSKTEQGTYRYDYIHIPDEETSFNQTYTASAARSTTAPKEPETFRQKPTPEEKPKLKYEDFYEVRPVLSYNESRNYKTLKEAADRKGYTVQIKMKLSDIVKPRSGQHYDKYYDANLKRINQYHVDFTILNDRMKIIAVIELDDNSHDRPDRIERDDKIDSILIGNGIKVIHTWHITDDILDDL